MKTFTPDEENSKWATPDESMELETTVGDKLDYINKHLIRYWDLLLQKETANQNARSDVVVNEEVLIKDAPVGFLLGMEHRLRRFREVLVAIPTLTPNIKWVKDLEQNADGRIYRLGKPVERVRTAKTVQHRVLYEATEHHPAQVDRWDDQIRVGVYQEMEWSGALSPGQKSKVLGRLDKLIRAVKTARMRANTQQVGNVQVASKMLDFIMGDI